MSCHVYGVKAIKALVWFIMTLYTYVHPLKSSNFASFLRLVPMFQPISWALSPLGASEATEACRVGSSMDLCPEFERGHRGPQELEAEKVPRSAMKHSPSISGYSWNDRPKDRHQWNLSEIQTLSASTSSSCDCQELLIEAVGGKCAYLVSLSSRHLTAKRERFRLLLEVIPHSHRSWWSSFGLTILWFCFDRPNQRWLNFRFLWCANVLCFSCISVVHSIPCARCLCNNQIFLENNTSYIHNYIDSSCYFIIFIRNTSTFCG